MFRSVLELMRMETSGSRAKTHVGEIANFHRVQGSTGYRMAAEYCVKAYEDIGLKGVEMIEYPADGKTAYWTFKAFRAWETEDAELWISSPRSCKRLLARFKDEPMSLVERSAPTHPGGVEAELVLVEDGTEEEDYKGKEVEGKVVLTSSGDLERVRELAVEKRGALGVITYVQPGHPLLAQTVDLKDSLRLCRWWWTEREKKCFGFVVSPKTGEELKRMIDGSGRKMASSVGAEDEVRVFARVDTRFYDGSLEVVTACIPGVELSEEEVILVAHLCHPRQSANDNASGVGACLEIAKALNKLIRKAKLPRPKRTIRFIHIPETNGLYCYLANSEDKIPGMVAGMNVNMVGSDQILCKGPLTLDKTPDSLPSYTNNLAERILIEVTKEFPNRPKTLCYPLFGWDSQPYSGSGDAMMFVDPTVGVPMPHIYHWPDAFWHTSHDTMDKVSEEELKRAMMIAATYAYFIANAGYKEALWLANLVVTDAKEAASQEIQRMYGYILDRIEMKNDVEDIMAEGLKEIEEKIEYVLERETLALNSVMRLLNEKEMVKIKSYLEDLEIEIKRTGEEEIKRVKKALEAHAEELGIGRIPLDKRLESTVVGAVAAGMVPKMIYRGPIYMREALARMSTEDRETYRSILKSTDMFSNDLELALFWADGKKTIMEIAEALRMERGRADLEALRRYFTLLERYGYVNLMRVEAQLAKERGE